MKCKECGDYNPSITDWEPAVCEADRMHLNYDPDMDAVYICPRCYDEHLANERALYNQYQSGYAYACGYRD